MLGTENIKTVKGIDWNSLSPPCDRKQYGCENHAEVLAEWRLKKPKKAPHKCHNMKVAICKACAKLTGACKKCKEEGAYHEIGPL